MPNIRPSTDRTRGYYYRRPFHSLNLERLRAATIEDLPVLREALEMECASRRRRDKLVVSLILRINELTHD